MERHDAKGFVEDFNRTYEETTELRRILGHRFYGQPVGAEGEGELEDVDGDDGEEENDDAGNRDDRKDTEQERAQGYDDEDLRYFQIGRRTALPVSLVTEGRYAYVSDAVVGALCEGEKSFVGARLSLAADEGEIPTVKDEPARVVEAALEYVETPDHILLPRTDACDEAVARWKEDGRLRRFGDSSYLRGTEADGGDGDENGNGETRETDCWLHRYDATHGADEAFVLEDGGVTVVQKKGRDALPPTGFGYVAEYEDMNDDMPLTVYFGEERREGKDGYDEFFDVVYRVILSEPVVEDGGVCRVRSV